MIRHLLSRLGCLFLMVGVLLLILGIAAEQSGEPAFNFLVIGFLLFISGFFLWRKLRQAPRRNTRFSLFRKRNREEDVDESNELGWRNTFDD